MKLAALLSMACAVAIVGAESPARAFLVAHRGASAYAPEHTLAAYRLALEQGADYVEQDLTLTKDGVLVCLHDETLERTTDVEARFPDRAVVETAPGGAPSRRWYAGDFTLAELRTLDAGSWFDAKFAGERVPTFDDAIALVKGRAGIFPELKAPAKVRARGHDFEGAVADALRRHGLADATVGGRPAVYLQSFDETTIRRVATLLPKIPRALLVRPDADAPRWLTADGLRELKTFATAIAPARQLIETRPGLVADAHAAGLAVVPYTFRSPLAAGDAGRETVRADMRRFLGELKVDGLFTDNPDLFPR
jgi:glycerophosphoryl diester phosphodiesterase